MRSAFQAWQNSCETAIRRFIRSFRIDRDDVRTALLRCSMDVTTPAVAATQFTAYMALLNLVIQYSARWQGLALERWGYPITLTLDAALGLTSLVLLPLVTPRRKLSAKS